MTTTTNTTAKRKIQKTNRIRLRNATIYTSCEVVRHVKPHLMRCNQILVPLKDHFEPLVRELRQLVQTHPDHFPESSKEVINLSMYGMTPIQMKFGG